MNTREQYLALLRSMIGAPYRWGAWGPDVVDCSGLVSYCLGLPAKRDAAELWHDFQAQAILPAQAAPGSLYFYGPDKDHINHVMSVLAHWNNSYMILAGACHGDSTTINDDVAKVQGAAVLTQPQGYWQSHFQYAVDPFNT
jgi:cell wall-associated NlpC family hydrolase